jgi:hypothetical protein
LNDDVARPAEVNARIAEIVGELDRLVPVDGAAVIVYIDTFWQTFPPVSRDVHHCAFLGTPLGFVRFGVELMKAAVSAPRGKGSDGESVPLELDYLLRQDSNPEFSPERVTPSARWTPRRRVPPAFDWEEASRDVTGCSWLSLLEELDRAVPAADEEVLITVPRDRFPDVPIWTTAAGFIRLGLEFAKGALAPPEKRGRNGGDSVHLDLDYLIGPDSEVVFDFERVAALPEDGDRRRSRALPGLPALAIAVTVLVLLVRGCLVR